MDPLQAQFEQSVGDRFASWLSARSGKLCSFLRRADRAPDLVYSFDGRELFVEVTAAYYDAPHAAFLWKGARGAPDAPAGWSGVNPSKSLAEAIATRIREKSKKFYGENTVLLIEVPPGVTSAEDLQELLAPFQLQRDAPFVGIYVVGNFPITGSSPGGYRVLPLMSNVGRQLRGQDEERESVFAGRV